MTFTITNTFSNGTTADADEVNTNFTDVENELNGTTETSILTQMWSHIEEQNPSGAASVDFTGISGYKMLKVVFDLVTDTDNTSMFMRLNNDSGANYNYHRISNAVLSLTTSQSEFILTSNTGATDKCQAVGEIVFNVTHDRDTGQKRIIVATNISIAQGGSAWCMINPSEYIASADLTRITIFAASGNITGYCSLYGVKN